MALGPNKRFSLNTGSQAERMTGAQAHAAGIDAGLRAYMLKVYNYMCIGLALTGAVAFATSTSNSLDSHDAQLAEIKAEIEKLKKLLKIKKHK